MQYLKNGVETVEEVQLGSDSASGGFIWLSLILPEPEKIPIRNGRYETRANEKPLFLFLLVLMYKHRNKYIHMDIIELLKNQPNSGLRLLLYTVY